MLAAALFVLAAVLALLALLWALQRRLIYLPFRRPPPAATLLAGAREVTLQTVDGIELGAWFLPAGGMLLFDYRGDGGNRGRPTEAGLARDVPAALLLLAADAGLPRERLLYYGESLGAGVVAELATEYPPAGLVLRSPFTDLASVGRVHYPVLPVRLLLRDRFPVAAQLARVKVPITVVYGTDDRIVPPEQSRAVAAAAGGPTRLLEIEGADHNDRALLDGAALIAAVVELAERCGGGTLGAR